jgi:hypothetical protein
MGQRLEKFRLESGQIGSVKAVFFGLWHRDDYKLILSYLNIHIYSYEGDWPGVGVRSFMDAAVSGFGWTDEAGLSRRAASDKPEKSRAGAQPSPGSL